ERGLRLRAGLAGADAGAERGGEVRGCGGPLAAADTTAGGADRRAGALSLQLLAAGSRRGLGGKQAPPGEGRASDRGLLQPVGRWTAGPAGGEGRGLPR